MELQESLHRVLQRQENLADLFYQVFLERYPEIRPYFQGVDLKHQATLLTMALLVVERHFRDSYPAVELYLQYLGGRHHRRGIPRELYPKFCAALLATLERFHGVEWDSALEYQWESAMGKAATTMLSGYGQYMHV